MFGCREVKDRLGRYFDRELSDPERHMVEDHLEQCSRCSAQLQEIRDLAEVFQEQIPVPPVPPDLSRTIMAKAQAQIDGTLSGCNPLIYWRNWSLSMRLAALGVAAAACYVGIIISSSSLPPTPQASEEMKWIGMTSQGPIVAAYVGSRP